MKLELIKSSKEWRETSCGQVMAGEKYLSWAGMQKMEFTELVENVCLLMLLLDFLNVILGIDTYIPSSLNCIILIQIREYS